jgi:hypothetical protein
MASGQVNMPLGQVQNAIFVSATCFVACITSEGGVSSKDRVKELVTLTLKGLMPGIG